MQRKRVILKVSLVLLLSIVCLIYPVQGFAAESKEENSSQWGFSKEISLEEKAPYHELYLDEEVYGEAADDLRDVRIVNSKGEFVPFYMDNGVVSTEESTTIYSSKLIHTAKKGMDILYDYKITPVQENTDIQGNKLVFELPGEAFLKHVQVFGGYDGNVWEPLKKDDLYSTEGLEKNVIELGTTYKFNHYRLVVENNIENLNFGKLQLLHNNQEVKTTDFKRQLNPVYEIKQVGSQTQILIHNSDRLKVSKVLLDSTGNFTRPYMMLDESGQSIETEGNGELYQLDFKDTKIAATDIVTLSTVNSPVFTIVIYNRDDAPIDISGIRMEYLVDKLVFAEKGEGPYQLLYGNTQISAPRYDILSFKNLIEGGDMGHAKLGAEKAAQKTTDSSSKSNWFQSKIWFNGVIITVSLLLIIILIRKMNRT